MRLDDLLSLMGYRIAETGNLCSTHRIEPRDGSRRVSRWFLILSHVHATQEIHAERWQKPRFPPDVAILHEFPQRAGIHASAIFRLCVLHPFFLSHHN